MTEPQELSQTVLTVLTVACWRVLLILILYLPQHGERGPSGQEGAVYAVQLRVAVRGRRREQLQPRHQQHQQRLEGGRQQCTPKKCGNYR